MTNTGDADLTVSAVGLSDTDHFSLDMGNGENPMAGLPVVIPATVSRTFGVHISSLAAGTHTANLTITTDDPDRPGTNVTIMGNVIEARPAIRLSASAFFFGSVAVGESSEPFTFSIVNTGNAPLPIDRVTLTDDANFSLALNGGNNPLVSLPVSIAAGESRTINVTFIPSADRGFSASLVIGTNDQALTEAKAVLSGNNLPVPRDVDGDGAVTLADTIFALQIAVRINSAGVNLSADVNNDGRIGLAETIYILQKVAEMR